jgi:hypothetical protein
MAMLDEGGQALQEGRYDQALRHGTKYLESENPEVREAAHFMVGMSYFRQNKFRDAIPYFQLIVGDGNGGGLNDSFNLVMAATLSGQHDLGRDAFEKFLTRVQKEGNSENGMSILLAHLYYGMALADAGDPEAAYEQLETLRPYYEKAKITDDHFLWQRGIPFLAQFIQLAEKIIASGRPPINWKQWAKNFAEKLDEEGYNTLAKVARF